MDNYLSKPLRAELLDKALTRWIGSRAEVVPLEESVPSKLAEADPPLFDPDESFDRLTGDPVLAKRLAQVFVDNMPRDLLALANAVDRSDSSAIVFAAHTIRVALRDLAAKVEPLGRGGCNS